MVAPLLRCRRSGWTRALTALSLGASMSVASACATLETIPLQACGNHVTETSEGEDCDGLPEGSPFTCGDPGSDHECKYVWTSENESCPDSYVKSLDGRCRKPSLTFEAAKAYNLPGEQPQIGDIDADGTDEIGLLLRGLGPDNAGGQFVLTSLDGVGTTFASFPIGKSALLGDLSGDGLTDVVFPTEPGFSVMLSREGELSLKVYTAKLPDQTLGLFPLPVWLAGDIGENLDLSLLGAMVQGSNGPELCLDGWRCRGPVGASAEYSSRAAFLRRCAATSASTSRRYLLPGPVTGVASSAASMTAATSACLPCRRLRFCSATHASRCWRSRRVPRQIALPAFQSFSTTWNQSRQTSVVGGRTPAAATREPRRRPR
jgi:hypothetical protein